MSKLSKKTVLIIAAIMISVGGGGYYYKTQIHDKGAMKDKSFVEKANDFIAKGYYTAAVIQYKNAIRKEPRNSELRLKLGNLYLFIQDSVSAEIEFTKALEFKEGFSKSKIGLAKSYLHQNKFEEIIKILDISKINVEDYVDAYYLIGSAYQALGNLDDALDAFIKGEKLDKNNEGLDIAIARLYKIQGETEKALLKTDEALKLNENNFKALVLKGELLKVSDGPAAALPFFEKVLKAQPNNLFVRMLQIANLITLDRDEDAEISIEETFKIKPDFPLAHYYRALINARKGNLKIALDVLYETGGALDDYPPAMFLRGLIAYRRANYEKSSVLLEKLVKKDRTNMVAKRLYGAVLYELGEHQKIINSLMKIVEARQADATVYGLMASSYMSLGLVDEGKKYYGYAIIASGVPSIYDTQYALTKFAKGDVKGAMVNLEEILNSHKDIEKATLYLTLLAHREGDFEKALKSTDKYIKLSPNNPLGYNLKGTIFAALKKTNEAKSAFIKALKLDPNFVSAKLNLARLEMGKGNSKVAKKLYQEIIALDKNNVMAYSALSKAYLQEGDSKKSHKYISKAIKMNPKDITLRVNLVQAYAVQNRLENAKDTAYKIIQDFPQSSVGYEALGNIYLSLKSFQKAVDNFKAMQRILRNNEKASQLLAWAYFKNKQNDKSRKTLMQALGFSKNKATTLNQLINLEISSKNYPSARKYILKYKKAGGDKVGVDVAKARIYLGEGQYKDAQSSFLTAQKQGAKSILFIQEFAKAYFLDKKHDKGRSILEKWLKDNGEHSLILHDLGEIYLNESKYDKALKSYQAILKLNNKDVVALNNISWVYLQKGQNDKALKASKKAYDILPTSGGIVDSYAWCLTKIGNFDKASKLLKKAVKLSPKNLEIQYHYGYALYKLGRLDKAREVLKKAVGSGANYQGLQDAKNLLKKLN